MPTNPSDPRPKGGFASSTSEAGYEGAPKETKNCSGRLNEWSHLSTFWKIVDQGARSFGPLRTTIAELTDCIGILEDVSKGKKEYETLRDSLEGIFVMLIQHYDGVGSPAITASIESLCRDINQELESVKNKLNRARLERFKEASSDLDHVLRCYERIRDRLQRVSLNADISMWKIVDTSATDNRLDRLQPAMSACYNSAQAAELKRGRCTEGTRIDVLSQMVGWLGTSSPGSVYWMNGMAGTGKTTIAYSLCEELVSSGRLVVSFFCSRVLPECRDANRVIPSIAYQLARSSRPFRSVLSNTLEKDPDVHTRLPNLQFDALIAQPLLQVKDTLPEGLVVIIDALDECKNKESSRQVLDILLTKSEGLPLKFIVSSRPEPEIRDGMTKQIDQIQSRVVLHELDAKVVRDDIKTYLQATLARIQPSRDQIAALADKAGILFIYAATVVRYIGYNNFQGNSEARLLNLLNATTCATRKEIDELYSTVLCAALEDSELEDTDKVDMKEVLHTVICAQEPLTVDGLSGLLMMNNTKRVHAALRPLWSVLHIFGTSETVFTLHASFPDYMLDPSRSGEYYCDQQAHNQILALRCFNCFRNISPQFNVCGLESSFVSDDQVEGLEARVERSITTDVFYAARYWGAHLCSALRSTELVHQLEEFLSVRLLLWMEVMNLKKSTSAMPEVIRLVEQEFMSYSTELKALIHDAWRFTVTFASGAVSKSTPHIYTSMLPFWPSSGPISRLYVSRTQRMIRATGTAISQRQHALLATWHFSNFTFSPIFSPDGTQIAVGIDHDVFLLNASTGQRVLNPLKGHSDKVTTIQFSPDGAQIVSGSWDMSIRVWSTQRGETVLGPLMKHTSRVCSVAFSPEGTCIVSGSSNGTICIWDARGGQLMFDWFTGHAEQIHTVKYPSNARYVISIGRSSGIVTWDPKNGQIVKRFRRNSPDGSYSSGDMSPDGTRIASGFSNNSIYIWDVQTGQTILGPLAASSRSFSISSVSFSPDGYWIVSGSNDKTVCVWDTRTGDLVLGPLEGHTKHNVSASFSPDSAYIVSGSVDSTLRLWDTPQSVRRAPKLLHSDDSSVRFIDISPDGTRIASGSEDGTLCVWESESGESIMRLCDNLFTRANWLAGEEEFCHVRRVTFSPDNTRLIVNTDNGPFVFEARTGLLCNLYDETIPFPYLLCVLAVLAIFCVLLPLEHKSGKGSTFVIALLINARILLGNASRIVIEGLKMDFIGFQDPVNNLNALVSQAFLITVTGVRIFGDTIFGPVDIYSPRISCAEFSPDGTRIVSGSADGIVRVHDARTNRLILVIILPSTDTNTCKLESVSFSSNNRYIFLKSEGGTIQRHDANSGQLLVDSEGTIECGYTDEFSPDGARIAAKGHSSITLVDLASRKRLELSSNCLRSEFTGFSFWSGSVRFTPDNAQIATIMDKGLTVAIWDTQTGKMLLELNKELIGPVRSMAFLPDGGSLVTGSKDGTVQITDVRSASARNSDRSSRILDWGMNKDGWIVDDQSQLLIWVPPDLRTSLMWPRTKRIISRRGWLRLGFDGAYLGESWVKCYRPE